METATAGLLSASSEVINKHDQYEVSTQEIVGLRMLPCPSVFRFRVAPFLASTLSFCCITLNHHSIAYRSLPSP